MKNKLKFIVLGIIILITKITIGQQVNYEVIYNSSTCLYEAHAHVVGGTLVSPNTIPFPSKFSVVVPASISNLPFTVIQNYNPQGLSWSNSNNIYAPASSPNEDFHAFTVSGGGAGNAYPIFTTGTNILLFTFSVPHIGCNDGIRCYINGSDPNSGAPGMAGIDFTQSFKTFPNVDRYLGNIGSPVSLPHPSANASFSFQCNNINDLFLTTTANNYLGCGSLSYNWSGSGGFSSSLQNPVVNPYSAPGIYSVTVTDANGCTISSSINLSQPTTLITASISNQVNINCFGNSTGSATVSASGGTPPYNYAWNTTPVQNTLTASGLSVGTYIATVTDNKGCTTTASATISQPAAALSATAVVTNSSCNLSNNGSINITTIGGSPNYSYLWSNNATTEDISNLTQGNYTVSITDNNACNYTSSFNISANNCQPIAVNDIITTNEDTPVNGNVTPNDTPSGDGGNIWTLVGTNGGAAHGIVSMNPNGNYTYTPDPNYNGTDVFSYKVCDTDNDCSTATVTITINPVDDAPIAVNDIITTNEDTQVNGTVAGNDTPSGDGGNIWTLVGTNGGAAHGIVSMNPNGTYTYIPNPNYNGTDVFSYKVCDADNDCSTTTVTITINPLDDTPIAINDNITTNEDTPINGTVVGNDTPSGDGGNIWTMVGSNGGATHGIVSMNPNGTYTYTPDPNYNGTDVFSYKVCDADNDCSTATVTITINPVDDAPIAVNDIITTNEDTPVNGNVITNDTPSGDGGNIWTLVGTNGGANHGTVSMNPNGTYTYTPNPNYNGTDVFSYKVCDADNDCSNATVTITINPVDDAPIAVNDIITTNEDTSVNGTVVGNDTPSGDGGNIWSLVNTNGGAVHGIVSMNPNGSYTYTPDPNYNGTDVFSYKVCDVDNDCSTATVTITINPVDDAPIAVNDIITTNEDTPVNSNVNTNDTPSGDGGNIWTLVGTNGGATHGNVSMNPNGTYTYTPDLNYNGTDVFSYKVCDADNDCSTATVTITINPVDDAPIAVNDIITTYEDTPVNGNVTTNDTPSGDGGNIWTLVGTNGGATHGSVSINPNGTYTYTPDPNYNGTDIFSYKVCDADNDCSTATVTITINPIDDAPIANFDIALTNEDQILNATVVTNDILSGDGGNVWTLLTNATHGNVIVNANGTFTYTPNANYNGSDSFIYKLCDTDNDCDTAIVYLTINPVNDLPIANFDLASVNEDQVLNATVVNNDVISGDGGNVWTLLTNPTHGNVIVNANGTYIYTPDANYNGADSFIYKLCDTDNDCDTAIVYLTINSVNDLPIANFDIASTNEDQVLNATVVTNDILSGDGGNTWTLLTNATHGNVIVNANGTYTYTPDVNYNGPDSFIYKLCDTDNDCDTAKVFLTINPVNDLPLANFDLASVNEDQILNATVVTNDILSGDGGNVWTLLTNATHGNVIVNANGTYTYTPNANYNGSDSFIYKLCDTDNDCDTAIVYLTINPVNDLPLANFDLASVNEDQVLNSTVITNDTLSIDGSNNWTLVNANGGALHGNVIMNLNGNYSYIPDANFNGNDAFIYKICDIDNDCDTAIVYLKVIPVNDPPIAINDTNTTNENTPVSGNILTNDSDPDGNILHVTDYVINGTPYIVGTTSNIPGIGSININNLGIYTFNPALNWSGNVPDISYSINDGFGGTASAILKIKVIPGIHYIDLSVTKLLTDPNPLINDTIYKNDTVTFTIVLKNNSSTLNAANISLLDTLPTGFTFVSATATSGNYNPVNGLWLLPNLNALNTATLTMQVKVDTSAENNVYIIGHDDPDSNLMNNHAFASVSVTASSSGGDGGVESNGNMASKMAHRKFIRHKDRSISFNDPSKMELFSPATIVTSKLKSTQATEMINFIPQIGPTGVPAMVSTPNDLIGISNAIEVVAVDYFDAVKRKAAILAIASNVGTVYEHTKMVCDRLDGGSLKSINYVNIKGHPFIIAGIIQDNGNTDYAVSFIAYKTGNTYSIDNQWDLEQYSPSGNQPVFNFQVWSINEQQTIELVSNVIDKMITAGYNIVYKNTSYPKFPDVYIKNGLYKDGNLEMNLTNTSGANTLQFFGSKALVEDGIRYPFNYSTPISTNYNSNVNISSGNIFDIGFSMGNNVSSAKDVLYFADGPWGKQYDQAGATITDFSISTQFNPPVIGAFNLGRNANLEGTVKTNVSLFRILRVGGKPINLTAYSPNLIFTAFGSGSFDVIISKAGIINWNEQYKTTINLNNNNPVIFNIPLIQFTNALGQHNLTVEDAVSVVFVKKGNNSTYQNFTLNVKDMRFGDITGINENNNKISAFIISPNPFNNSATITFNLPKNQKVKIDIFGVDGKLIKTVVNKIYPQGLNNETINAEDLKAGVYMIKLESESTCLFEKVVLMK